MAPGKRGTQSRTTVPQGSPKGRRVSFAEAANESSSQQPSSSHTETAVDWTGADAHATSVPYDSLVSHFSTSDIQGLLMTAPMIPQAAAPSPAGWFAGPRPMPPRPFWTVRPPVFRYRPIVRMPPSGLEPFSNMDVGGGDGPEALSLLNVCLALLVVAIVGVSVILTFAVDLPLGGIGLETSSAPRRIGMANKRIVVPRAGLHDPPARNRYSPRPARPGASVATASPATAETEAEVRRLYRRHHVGNRTRRLKRPYQRRCGRHFYTYCAQTKIQEAYYSTVSHRCVSTGGDDAHVCNQGANRFTDLESCLASCVHRGRQQPRERCFQSTLFTGCSSRDVTDEWWIFDGTGCAQWNFPLGKCPAQGSWVFSKREECEATCVLRGAEDDRSHHEDHRCEIPAATTCSPRQIKFPYFADMQAEGTARCVKASGGTLSTRRCLIGWNRFDSLSACSRVCDRRSHAERHEG